MEVKQPIEEKNVFSDFTKYPNFIIKLKNYEFHVDKEEVVKESGSIKAALLDKDCKEELILDVNITTRAFTEFLKYCHLPEYAKRGYEIEIIPIQHLADLIVCANWNLNDKFLSKCEYQLCFKNYREEKERSIMFDLAIKFKMLRVQSILVSHVVKLQKLEEKDSKALQECNSKIVIDTYIKSHEEFSKTKKRKLELEKYFLEDRKTGEYAEKLVSELKEIKLQMRKGKHSNAKIDDWIDDLEVSSIEVQKLREMRELADIITSKKRRLDNT